jgi:hypothetical protein
MMRKIYTLVVKVAVKRVVTKRYYDLGAFV